MSKVNHGNYTDSVSQLKDGHAQVFTLITTVPASSVMDLASARDIRVLEFPNDKFQALQKINKGYDKRIIKSGSYPKQDKDIQTIGTWTHLVASCKLPEQLVYNITKALANNVENLGNVVAAVKGLSVKDMAADVGVPYHPARASSIAKRKPSSSIRSGGAAGAPPLFLRTPARRMSLRPHALRAWLRSSRRACRSTT
jgi:uncharacterized protein